MRGSRFEGRSIGSTLPEHTQATVIDYWRWSDESVNRLEEPVYKSH